MSDFETLEPRRLCTAGIPRPDHVVIVVEENHSYSSLIGSADAPYLNRLAREGASFTDYRGIIRPSQPNYLALFSGSTQGVTDNNVPPTFSAPSLGGQLIAAGLDFAGYSEDLPRVGFTGEQSGGYRRKHNPWVDFSDVPPTDNLPFTQFPQPGNYARLPTVSFVIPNVDHDMHDQGDERTADDWLRTRLDPYVQWAKTHNSLLVLTFDESDKSGDPRFPTIIVGDHVRPGNYSQRLNHYNLLRTIEEMYGLPPLGNAARAAPITNVWATRTASVGASADVYTWDATPATNYGSAAVLDVKTNKAGFNREAYFKFDTAGTSGGVARATLRFYGKLSSAGSFAAGVFAVADTGWAETAVTWRRCPRFGSRLATATVTSTSQRWYEVDVTNYVRSQRTAERATVSFGLHGLGYTVAKLSIASSEAAANRPQLVLTMT